MNKKLLTMLGCSGSIALSLMTANSVEAREYVFTAPQLGSGIAEIPESKTDYPFADCSCNQMDAETAAEADRQGEKAIQLYGCDCAGCRNMARNFNVN